MSLLSDDAMYRQRRREESAARLAIAASRLRDADDALVTWGRQIRDGNADRGMPEGDEGTRAIELCGDVTVAYAEMRSAEQEWEAVRDAR
jgi:hypothetical protein